MTRRGLSAGLAVLGGAMAAPPAVASATLPAASTVLRMAYVDAPAGQLHYRHQGEGPALVLLHWAPASGRQYEPVMPLFVGAGFQPLAFDLPGYGRSYKAERGFSVDHMADALVAGLSALGHRQFHLLGGHLSASVATRMAAIAPARVRSLTLDGVLLLEPAEWTALLARFAGKSPMPASGPGFRAFPFDMAVETLSEWNPDFALSEATLGQVYDLLNDYMEMGLAPIRAFVEPAADALPPPPFDLATALKGLEVPTLFLSAEREPLRASFARAADMVRGSRRHSFDGTHPLLTPTRAADYAAAVLAHLRSS